MSSLSAAFLYDVQDIHNSIRRTNTLLRGVNAVRLLGRDIKQLVDRPTVAGFFWTLIQITRAYNALRRIYIITMLEMNKGITKTRLVKAIPFAIPKPLPPEVSSYEMFDSLNVRVDAFLNNMPITLDKIDLTDLPNNTRIMVQAIMEEDAEQTVLDAQDILISRILHPEDSTGFLSASIGWMPEVSGTRIFADAYYSWWVEEGHDNFTGHHFMADATERARLRLPEKIRLELNGLIFNETI
jgi:hypothetical protein